MVDKNEANPQDDEVILCVRYTTVVGWLLGIAIIVFGTVCYYAAYDSMLRRDFLRAFIAAIGCIFFPALGIQLLFTKHILFYRDRIVKVWYFFGQRTIPYRRAKLISNPVGMGAAAWLVPNKALSVKETDDRGKVRLIQIPVGYCFYCVAPEIRDKVEAVLSYLVGVEDRSKLYEESGLFVKSTLPKELLGQD